jgi:arylsulfatase A-like enzyme
MNHRPSRLLILLLTGVATLTGCGSGEPPDRPNIVFVVWDTVRADHLGLYGYQRPTTPFLDKWAQDARVYDDCITVGSTTVPSHSSMFTGLLPTEHGTSNEKYVLSDEFETLAELLRAAGYGTYMFSANPFVSEWKENASLTQGFDTVEHPWSERYYDRAIRITLSKVKPYDRSNPLAERIRTGKPLIHWNVKASGELAQQGVKSWLGQQDPDRPFFIFLNYMEAHAPLLPSDEHRLKMMSPEQVRASYNVNRHFMPVWSYVFGLENYTPEEIALTAATYDAAILELNILFQNLIGALEADGRLENTIVVLLGDHGDQLGEHHMLDHQFSVYEPLMHIPLVVYYPKRFAPGRDPRPVMNLDLFPTLLELAGLKPPVPTKGISLLHTPDQRPRLGECPHPMYGPLRRILRDYPDFDPRPWRRSLRAYYDGPFKFIQGSDDRHELYNLVEDPGELRNLVTDQPEIAKRLNEGMRAYLSSSQPTVGPASTPSHQLTPEERQALEEIGYMVGSDDEETKTPKTQPAPASRPIPKEATSRPNGPQKQTSP